MKTLNEVAKIVGMSRRVIQEYERTKLATTPTTTNKYGHLLYDDKAIERLWQIRFYRELGYNKAQIKSIFSDPSYNKHDAISAQIALLEEKKEHLESLIETAKALNNMGLTSSAFRFGVQGMQDATFDSVFPIIGAAFGVMQSQAVIEEAFVPALSEEDGDCWFEAVDTALKSFNHGAPFDSDFVQKQIGIMHGITAKELSDSVILFSWNNLSLSPGTEEAAEIDEIYGTGSSEFLFQAIHYYCSTHADNSTDRELTDALQVIERLGKKHYTTYSEEVQREVQRIHNFFSGISVISQEAHLRLLRNMGELFGTKAYRDLIDNGAEKGVSWFISRAIQIYCDRLKDEKRPEDKK